MGAYLLVSLASGTAADDPRFEGARQRAEAAGMAISSLSSRTWVGVAGPGCPSILAVGAWTLVGDVFNRANAPVRRVRDDDPHVYEKKLIARFWGRFVGVRLDANGCVAALLRDPSGALDCVYWSDGPLTFVASDAPEWLIDHARPRWRIDASRVEAALHDPFSTAGELLLDGPDAVLPGTMRAFPDGAVTDLWRPDWLVRSSAPLSDAEAASALREAVDETVAGFARLPGVLAGEVSGGLDSSVVAATLEKNVKGRVGLWLNAWGPDPSGDERPWAEALASHLDISLVSVPRATGRVTQELLQDMPQGFRPGLAALDGLHDADWARRFEAHPIDRIMTGKGGDSVFIQPADIGVFVDLWRARGWRALLTPDLVRLARWNERSVWSLLTQARRRDWSPAAIDAPNRLLRPRQAGKLHRHPWLDDIEDLGPSKRRQILGLVQGVGLHGPSLQTQSADVAHPLLAQPVVELCLALPTPQLTLGRRDRGLARHAFGDRLPASIAARRSKGEMTAFYGRMIADGLDVLRPWLLEGRLAAMGFIDTESADRILTRESLAWLGGYVDIMVTAATEGWVRAWERRLFAA